MTATKYIKAGPFAAITVTGAGTIGDPYVLNHNDVWSPLGGGAAAQKAADIAKMIAGNWGFALSISSVILANPAETAKWITCHVTPIVAAGIEFYVYLSMPPDHSQIVSHIDARVSMDDVYIDTWVDPFSTAAEPHCGYVANQNINHSPVDPNTGTVSSSDAYCYDYWYYDVTHRTDTCTSYTTAMRAGAAYSITDYDNAFGDGIALLNAAGVSGYFVELSHWNFVKWLLTVKGTARYIQWLSNADCADYMETKGGNTKNAWRWGVNTLKSETWYTNKINTMVDAADEVVLEIYSLYMNYPYAVAGRTDGTVHPVFTGGERAYNYGGWLNSYIHTTYPSKRFGVLTDFGSPGFGSSGPWSSTISKYCKPALTNDAASGQKVVKINTSGFYATETVTLYDGFSEHVVIDTVDSPTQITLTEDLDDDYHVADGGQVCQGATCAVLTLNALAAQKVCTVDDTTGLVAGAIVTISDGFTETGVIDTIDGAAQMTLVNNLTYTYHVADDAYVQEQVYLGDGCLVIPADGTNTVPTGRAGSMATALLPFDAPHTIANQQHANAKANLEYDQAMADRRWDTVTTEIGTSTYVNFDWQLDEINSLNLTNVLTLDLSDTGLSPIYTPAAITGVLDNFNNTGNEIICLKNVGAGIDDFTVEIGGFPSSTAYTLTIDDGQCAYIGPFSPYLFGSRPSITYTTPTDLEIIILKGVPV